MNILTRCNLLINNGIEFVARKSIAFCGAVYDLDIKREKKNSVDFEMESRQMSAKKNRVVQV